jgi:hypothetical protein
VLKNEVHSQTAVTSTIVTTATVVTTSSLLWFCFFVSIWPWTNYLILLDLFSPNNIRICSWITVSVCSVLKHFTPPKTPRKLFRWCMVVQIFVSGNVSKICLQKNFSSMCKYALWMSKNDAANLFCKLFFFLDFLVLTQSVFQK